MKREKESKGKGGSSCQKNNVQHVSIKAQNITRLKAFALGLGRNGDALIFSLFAAAVFGEMGEGAAAAGLSAVTPLWVLAWLAPFLLAFADALPTGVPFVPVPEA